jgi:oligopeptide/dipeptide ABC transporter ATP-binding protein
MTTHDGGDLLQVKNIQKYFPITAGLLRRKVGDVHAVDDVSVSIRRGETLGLVGESGCGKSTLGRLLLRLIEPTAGEVWFNGRNILEMGPKEMRALRREMQIVFQDPYSSLNPRMTVRKLIAEPIIFHRLHDSKQKVDEHVDRLMETVGLSTTQRNRYPHEFSGGQRQRIGIARGLAVNPSFVVCDEPISALDVSIQAQVLNLLSDLQKEFDLTYLFISHDLSVIRYASDRAAVMYLGNVVEIGRTSDLFDTPGHPYTDALLSAIPVPDPDARRDRILLPGDVPSASNPPSGCSFHPRCAYAQDICRTETPALETFGRSADPEHAVACHFKDELDLAGVKGRLLPTV